MDNFNYNNGYAPQQPQNFNPQQEMPSAYSTYSSPAEPSYGTPATNTYTAQSGYMPQQPQSFMPQQEMPVAQPTYSAPTEPSYGAPTANPYAPQQPAPQQDYGYNQGTSNQYQQYAPQPSYNPNANQYQQYMPQQNAPMGGVPVMEDPGKSKATMTLICAILALLFGWIPGAIGLSAFKQYSQIGNGQNASTAKIGKVMCIIGIVMSVVVIVFSLLAFIIGMVAGFSGM
jgi:hypothetical protein